MAGRLGRRAVWGRARLSVPGDRLLRRSLASFLVMGRVCCWRQDWQGLSLMVGRTPS
ncbi:hypothetical protein [Clostridium phoceensis]|uniref:hypothetical protein n=1 Tax=Clostridium phoceensis TaxID=1650661 RepID=UPI0023F2D5BC|nr:hypothetical protein [Clostridium phoceensis]